MQGVFLAVLQEENFRWQFATIQASEVNMTAQHTTYYAQLPHQNGQLKNLPLTSLTDFSRRQTHTTISHKVPGEILLDYIWQHKNVDKEENNPPDPLRRLLCFVALKDQTVISLVWRWRITFKLGKDGRSFSSQILLQTCGGPDLSFSQLQLGFLNWCNYSRNSKSSLAFT